VWRVDATPCGRCVARRHSEHSRASPWSAGNGRSRAGSFVNRTPTMAYSFDGNLRTAGAHSDLESETEGGLQ
jgi:hypothetical protein